MGIPAWLGYIQSKWECIQSRCEFKPWSNKQSLVDGLNHSESCFEHRKHLPTDLNPEQYWKMEHLQNHSYPMSPARTLRVTCVRMILWKWLQCSMHVHPQQWSVKKNRSGFVRTWGTTKIPWFIRVPIRIARGYSIRVSHQEHFWKSQGVPWIHLPEKSWLLGDPKIDHFKANTITNHKLI